MKASDDQQFITPNYPQLQNPKPEYLSRVICRTQQTMIRDYFCCCYEPTSSASEDVADRDPVLLVSGIAGTILHSKRKKSGLETRVWVRILLADLEFKKKLWSIYNAETGLGSWILHSMFEFALPFNWKSFRHFLFLM